jgi:hypothetical protein
MPGTRRLTDAEVAEIRRRRPGMRASLACESLYLPDEVEALFDQLEAERLPPDEPGLSHMSKEIIPEFFVPRRQVHFSRDRHVGWMSSQDV